MRGPRCFYRLPLSLENPTTHKIDFWCAWKFSYPIFIFLHASIQSQDALDPRASILPFESSMLSFLF